MTFQQGAAKCCCLKSTAHAFSLLREQAFSSGTSPYGAAVLKCRAELATPVMPLVTQHSLQLICKMTGLPAALPDAPCITHKAKQLPILAPHTCLGQLRGAAVLHPHREAGGEGAGTARKHSLKDMSQRPAA